MHALLSTVSTTLQATPEGLAFSWDMILNIPLVTIGTPFLHAEKNWSMMHCFVPTKSISILTTRLVKRFRNMTKRFKANSNLKLQDSLTFCRSILMSLWQFACSLDLLNMSMFSAPCHIGSPHLCNLIWNWCLFLVGYWEGECYAQLCLSQDSQESSFVDSCSSFYGSLWCHVHMPCMCSFIPLLFCHCFRWTPFLVLNPTFHNSKKSWLKIGSPWGHHTTWREPWSMPWKPLVSIPHHPQALKNPWFINCNKTSLERNHGLCYSASKLVLMFSLVCSPKGFIKVSWRRKYLYSWMKKFQFHVLLLELCFNPLKIVLFLLYFLNALKLTFFVFNSTFVFFKLLSLFAKPFAFHIIAFFLFFKFKI